MNNRFDILSIDDEVLEDISSNNVLSKLQTKRWADYSDDEENEDEKDDNKDEQKDKISTKDDIETMKQLKQFDIELCKLTQLSVVHDVRKYNKEDGSVTTSQHTRILKVVSKQTYDSLKHLIGKFKTHRGDTFNFKEQQDKIKLANQLLEWCYKDPKVPRCFVYPVAIIHTSNGKTITRNEVDKKSKSRFSISDITYYPTINHE